MTLEAKGHNGQLTLHEDSLEFHREGMLAKATGHRPFRLRLGQIDRVEIKEPSWITNGYLRVTLVGQDPKEAGSFQAAQDPAAVLFTKGQKKDISTLHDALVERLKTVTKDPAPPRPLSLRELIAHLVADKVASKITGG